MRRFISLLLCALPVVSGQTVQLPAAVTADQAVSEALEKNLNLLAAKFAIPVADARMITARLRPNPVVSISAEHLDALGTGFNAINNAGPQEFSYRTDFLLERGGKRAARIELAQNDRKAAELQVLDATRQIVLDVHNAFLDVQLARESLRLAEQNLKALDGIVDVNAIRVRNGDLAQVELSRSRVASLQFQAAVQQARIRLTEAKNRLQLLMGRTVVSPDFDVVGDFRRTEIPAATADELISRALLRRPDIEALRAAQARSQADVRLQLAQGKIDYTVGSEFRRQQGIAGTGNTLGVFFSAPLPVFNRNQGEIERAKRELEQAAARIRALEASIRNDVQTAFQGFQSSRQLLEQVESTMLDQAQQVRKITEYSYRRGEATLVEFLDAQRAFNDAMQTWNEARAQYARSLYTLDALTGGANP